MPHAEGLLDALSASRRALACFAALRVQAESGDTAAAMQLFEDIAYGDVEQGSIYDLSEANLIKVGPKTLREW